MHLSTAVRQLESSGLYYTERQLYYAVCRARLPQPMHALLHQLRWASFTLPAPYSPERFAAALAARRAQHGNPPGLLTEAAPAPVAPLAGREPDLAAYALPRVLFCQSAPIAAMLCANGAIMELGCPILAAGEPLPGPIAAGLARAPAPQALLLHDASDAGLHCAATLATQLPAGVRLASLGLRPDHAARLHLFVRRSNRAALEHPLPPDLTSAERRWLARGWTAELAAVPPFTLLRVLRQAFGAGPPALPLRERLRRLPATGFMSWP
jgi:hypothetical protein